MKKVIVLFSGGLDSLLAVRILQEQKVEVEALNIYTPFHDCVETSRRWAEKLDVPLLIEHVAERLFRNHSTTPIRIRQESESLSRLQNLHVPDGEIAHGTTRGRTIGDRRSGRATPPTARNSIN